MNLKKSINNKVLLTLFFGVFMGALDIAIVGPALSPIQDQFNAATRDLSWIFTIYILMHLIGTPILAKLSDTFGRKVIYLISIILFSIGSLIIVISPTFGIVVLGRAIQGFGSGGIFPVASAVIGDIFPPEKRGRALGLIGAVFGIAFIVGPILGGILLLIDWKIIFLINIPIAIILILMAVINLPSDSPRKKVTFDWFGTIIISTMLALFVFGINGIDTGNLFVSLISIRVLPFLLSFLILLIILIKIEKKNHNPIISPILFKTKQLKIAHLLAFGAGFCEISLVYLPILSITAFSVSPSLSSFMLIPSVFAMSIGSPTFGRMLDKFGSKKVINFGTSATAIGMFLLAFFINSWQMFFVSTIIIGFGLSALLGAPIRYILLNETDEMHRSSAQGLMAIFTSSGQLISAAIIGAIISSTMNSISGFSKAYYIIGIFTLILVLISFGLKKSMNNPINESKTRD